MAFRTNKVPAIEERTVSGSSVAFNSAFALPLKACKVSFSATQAGSGDPSPSNPRAISGVSAIGLTANSTPVSVSLGDTRYVGELNVLTGVLTIIGVLKTIDKNSEISIAGTNYIKSDACDCLVIFRDMKILTWSAQANWECCNILKRGDSGIWVREGHPNEWVHYTNQIHINIANDLLGITDYTQETLATAKAKMLAWLENNPCEFVVELAEPITVQLSPTDLSSILGNNTFSTDTGTLEITFADLQEKSASGSVATFNTALAMPLASCNIAVNAWQEGSGDPSPSNVRAIHGFSEVNATRAGKNLFDKTLLVQGSASQPYLGKWGVDNFATDIPNGSIFLSAGQYTLSRKNRSGEVLTNTQMSIYDENGGNLYSRFYVTSITFTVPKSMAVSVYINGGASGFTSWDDYDIQLEAGSTATAYEPYVTPTIYTIQLGQEVYGAEVDIVNGIAHVNSVIKKLTSADVPNGISQTYLGSIFYGTSSLPFPNALGKGVLRCNKLKYAGDSVSGFAYNTCISLSTSYNFWIKDSAFVDMNEVLAILGELKLEVVYPLKTPFDIQLTPTQIKTLIGNNTIFADTGDVDLVYKDLDIAKRGNFREVFNLPS